MKYFNKYKFYILILVLFLGIIVFCDYSYAQYKTRITINEVELNILPFEETNTLENNNE